jgi:lipopolysaccharide transport system permease protein
MEYEIKPHNKFSFGLKELWHYRELFYMFTWRDVKVKYKQTFLGVAWAMFQPIIMTLLFTMSFGNIISEKSNLDIPYPVFALSGFIIWNIFSSGLSSSGNSMVNNASIIKKIYFPRLIIPFSSVLVSLKYRDFRYILPFFIQALLFATPVIYPVKISGNALFQFILQLNPMYAPISLFRHSFIDAPIDMNGILISLMTGIILFFAGIYYFKKTEAYFADLA